MDNPGRKKLFLVDGMSQIFRAFYALPPLQTSKGIPTNAVRGFTSMLRKIIETYKPDYLGVAFDMAGPTFRHEAFADYKKDRPDMPEDLATQLPYIRRVCAALRVPILQSEKYEADDIIGTLTHQASVHNLDVVIVSQDKDMFQLVNDHVQTLRVDKKEGEILCDGARVQELMGLPPGKIIDYLALCGDAVDNIPGAPGIGEKGAKKLLEEFGSLEKLLAQWEQVSNKRYSQSLRDNQELILKSKDLATIRTDVPVELKLDDLRMEPLDKTAAIELFRELEFNTLLKDLESEAEKSEKKDVLAPQQPSSEPLRTAEKIESWIRKKPHTAAVSIYISPGDGSTIGSRGLCFGLASGEDSVVFDVTGAEMWRSSGLEGFLEDVRVSKQVHDSKSAALLFLRAGNINLRGISEDSMLMSYLLDANEGNHSLERVVRKLLNEDPPSDLAAGAKLTARVVPLLRREIDALGLKEVYEDIEIPLAAVLTRMEAIGVRVDEKILAGLSSEFEAQLVELTRKIYQLAGTEFNINSPKQLGEILFEKLNLPSGKKSKKSGQYSTAIEVLEELAVSYELPRLVLDYRQISKLKSTYVDALPKLIDPKTHRIHTSFNQTVAATGRLSSAEPNLQNIPIRTDLGRKIRSAFVPEENFLLLSADYSQIELRLLAHFSEDSVLIEAFQHGEDIHARTAQEIFGVPRLMQTPEHRRQAKAINFGIVYGLSSFGLAQQLGISNSEAKNYIDAYFARYQGVRKFLDRTIAETRKSGEVRTLFGRLRKIPDINSKNPALRNFAERTAVNTPLQGTAADLIKLAMIRIDEQLETRRLKTRMILQVHDELVFEVPEDELAELRKLVKKEMEHVCKLHVPLVVDISVGRNWMEAK